MFERFTEDGRQVVVMAQDEARAYGSSYIGAEHLLLALTGHHFEGVTEKLNNAGVSYEDLVKALDIAAELPKAGQIPFDIPTKEILKEAYSYAASNGSYADPRLVCLAMLSSVNSASLLLTEWGIDLDELVDAFYVEPETKTKDPLAHDVSSNLQELTQELERVRSEKERAISIMEFAHAADLRDMERKLNNKLRELADQQKADQLLSFEGRQTLLAVLPSLKINAHDRKLIMHVFMLDQ